MREVDENFTHLLVQYDGVNLFEELSDNFALIVLDDQDLRRGSR